MKNILIPTDFSEASKNALRYVVNFFRKNPCNFYLVYVNVEGLDYVQKPVHQLGTNILVERDSIGIDNKLHEMEKFFNSLARNHQQHKLTVLHEKGYFLRSLRKLIQEKHIELVVMGTKGADKMKELFTGSNTGNVITKVDCNTLVVPSNAVFKEILKVVFPIDLSAVYTNDVIKDLRSNINSDDAHLSLLYVSKINEELSIDEQSTKDDLLQILADTLPNTISFHTLEHNNVEQTVIKFAEKNNADLIVMISKDYGFLHKQLFDTTVEEVSFDTQIPLLSLQG